MPPPGVQLSPSPGLPAAHGCRGWGTHQILSFSLHISKQLLKVAFFLPKKQETKVRPRFVGFVGPRFVPTPRALRVSPPTSSMILVTSRA